MPIPVQILCAASRTLTECRLPTLPSLGDALAVFAAPASRNPIAVADRIAAAPWCAVVLLADRPLSATETALLLPVLPHSVVVLAGDRSIDPARLIEALRLRRAPSVSDLAAYLRLRRGPRELISAVEDALCSTDTTKLAHFQHPSTLNRRLAAFGPLRARGWRALFRLLRITLSTSGSVEQAAWEVGLDPRTLRRLTEELLGVGARSALYIPGWEWKLESALRRHGILTWPAATRHHSSGLAAPVLLKSCMPA